MNKGNSVLRAKLKCLSRFKKCVFREFKGFMYGQQVAIRNVMDRAIFLIIDDHNLLYINELCRHTGSALIQRIGDIERIRR